MSRELFLRFWLEQDFDSEKTLKSTVKSCFVFGSLDTK